MNGKLNPRIVIASLAGLLLVFGAFYLSPYGQETRLPDPRVEVVAGPAPEREFIDVRDENGDGVADWKETLSPKAPWLTDRQTSTSTATTTERTHTQTVAIDMLQRMLQSGMRGGTGDAETVLDRSNDYVYMLATDKLYAGRDVRTSPDTGTAALRAYGNAFAEITFANSVQKELEDEVVILDRAVNARDPAALADLALIAESYEGMTHDLLAIPVPQTLVAEHLDLINTLNAIAIDIRGFEKVFEDPLLALARIQRYEDDALGLYQAISNLYLAIDAAGVVWTDADAAGRLIEIK
ncbi:MAG: hypothetical protein WDZ93_04050 [Candidatus Paceibacterota bacterium]